MTKSVLFAALFLGVLLIAATSRSDVSSTSPTSTGADAVPEPITGSAATSAPGSEVTPHDPFTPYGIGAPAATWKYSDLSPDEQALADRNRDTTGWDKVHAAYATAVAEQAHRAAASSAQSQLGIDNLAGTGVVP